MTSHHQATMPRGRGRKRGRETALPCLQGGLGVRRAPFPTQVRRGGSRPPLQGATLPRQPKEQQGKRPTTAKTRAPLTGRSPSTTPAWSPKAPAALNSNVTVPPLTGQVLCPGSLSPSPPHLHASASSSCLLLPPSSPRRFFFFLLQQLLTDTRRTSSQCCGGSQRRADRANGAGHTKSSSQRVSFPAYRGPPATAAIEKGLGLRDTDAP